MILYFSATGNTQYAAERLAQATGDYTVSIRKCLQEGRKAFALKENENLGIVMPTYFQGMPAFLAEFVESLELTAEGAEHYAYSVSTCGAGYGNSGSEAVRAFGKIGVRLDATFRVRMVDNWNPYFDMTDRSYIRSAEEQAEADLSEVCGKAAAKESVYLPDNFGKEKERELAAAYEDSRRTAFFQVNETCVGCGLCARQCPAEAIALEGGKPVWGKERCLLCLGCVHKCPKNAIAYTEDTIGHGQYTNPHIAKIL